jgi:beta-1,4-mannosyltransferase
LASFIGGYKIYIDFHNYGYTILNLRIKNAYIIAWAKYYEKFFGRKAVKSFCVSDKMKEDLKENWNIDAITLYDRPLRRTQNVKIDKTAFFKKYCLNPPSEN